ncbi:MAG: Fic family protein [Bacilli bacterium]|nr:Fic family protein [Bacilli bacterium]
MKNIDTLKFIYYISNDNLQMIKEIENKLSNIIIESNINKTLKNKSKIRSIYSSLAIENNSLSLKSVENVIDNKIVLGKKKDIQEVKNINKVYEYINKFDYKSEEDFFIVHSLMMKHFDDDNGYYRDHGEGVKRDDKIIYTAPESIVVPSLMKSLFNFLKEEDNIRPIIKASLFHYYLVYIHPFSDGNGRMARFWVYLILINWNKKFEYISIEEEIYLNQEEYYDAISECHNNGNANVFIEFMLKIINNILDKTTQKTTQKIKLNNNQLKIIKYIKNNPTITKKELAKKLNITEDGVKYNLSRLTNQNIIKRLGSNRSGYWETNTIFMEEI